MSHESQDTRDVRDSLAQVTVAKRIEALRRAERQRLWRKIRRDLLSILIGLTVGAAILAICCWLWVWLM